MLTLEDLIYSFFDSSAIYYEFKSSLTAQWSKILMVRGLICEFRKKWIVLVTLFLLILSSWPLKGRGDGVADVGRISHFFCAAECGLNSTYIPASEERVACMHSAVSEYGSSCQCSSDSAVMHYANCTHPIYVNCTLENKTICPLPGVNGSFFCTSCFEDPNEQKSSTVYTPESRECECVNKNFTFITVLDNLRLTSQRCISTSSIQSRCVYPYMSLSPSNDSKRDEGCTCVDGFTLMNDGSCISSSVYQEMNSAAKNMPMNFPLRNLAGGSNLTFSFPVDKNRIVQSAAACHEGNATECEFLSNLCVLMNYNGESTPCGLYLYLHEKLGPQVNRLPQIYYFKSSGSLVESFSYYLNASTKLQFVLSVYDVSGVWLGMKPLVNELFVCNQSNLVPEVFMGVAGSLDVLRSGSWDWIESQSGIFRDSSSHFPSTVSTTRLYELFLINPLDNSRELIPVPLLLDFSNGSVLPKSALDSFFFQPALEPIAGSSTSPPHARYFRRFYVYSSKEASCLPNNGSECSPKYLAVTTAKNVSLVPSFFGSLKSFVPLYVVQYTSRLETKYSSTTQLDLRLPLAFSTLAETSNDSSQDSAAATSLILPLILKVILIVSSVISVLTTTVCLYGHMRRRQNMSLDFSALTVWIIYFLNHSSTIFLTFVFFVTWVMMFLDKFHSIDVSDSENHVYLLGLYLAGVVAKGIVLMYRVVEQCNVDYYLIDWERSKGQLLRENQLVPVSMWRSNFVANRLTRLQTLRYFHVNFVLIVTAIILLGFPFKELFVDGTLENDNTNEISWSHITALTLGKCSFIFALISLVIYLIEFQIYYRFVVVDPFQAFVDLCSVSNISVLILLEPMWGFYIHGRTVHAHADVNMVELQRNLALEAEGNLPVRGLGGQNKCQTFEVFVSPYMRQYLYLCEMEIEYQHHLKEFGGSEPCRNLQKTYKNPASWHFFEFLKRRKKRDVLYSKGGMMMKEQINQSLQQCVHRAEGSLFSKMILQRLIDFPPNIMYMNGAQRDDVGSKDLFFFDPEMSFKKCFLCYLDFDICLFFTGFFGIVAAVSNVYIAIIATIFVEFLIQVYREKEGRATFSLKCRIPESFLH